MADISKITTPDGNEYDIKDLKARSDLSNKMDKVNPTGSGSLSLNRKASTTIGADSVAVGYNTTASGNHSHAEGSQTTASGYYSHAEGSQTTASGSSSHAEGNYTTTSGVYSHAEGNHTIAAGSAQHVSGRYNIADNNNTYAEIIGNGTANTRSNARTLDWQGNETIAGDLTFNGSTSLSDTLDDKTTYIECTQAQYDTWEQAGTLESDVTYYIKDTNNPNVATASQVMYDNSDSSLSATNVQGAIDEVADKASSDTVSAIVRNLFSVTRVASAQFVIAAATNSYVDITITKAGYTAIGIVGITGSGTSGLAYSDFYLANSSTARVYYRNNTTGSLTTTLRLDVLYIKDA